MANPAFARIQEGEDTSAIRSGSKFEKIAPDDYFQYLDLISNSGKTFRLRQIGKFRRVGLLMVATGKADKWGKMGRFPRIDVTVDPITGEIDKSIRNPYMEAKQEGLLDIYPKTEFWGAFIDRAEQIRMPASLPDWTKEEEETGIKDMTSNSWTPVYGMRVTNVTLERLQALRKYNMRETEDGGEVACDLNDPDFGHDIIHSYEKGQGFNSYETEKATVEKKYNIDGAVIQPDDPLAEDEMEFLLPDIEGYIEALKEQRSEEMMERDVQWLIDNYNENMAGENAYVEQDDQAPSRAGRSVQRSHSEPREEDAAPARTASTGRGARRSFGRDKVQESQASDADQVIDADYEVVDQQAEDAEPAGEPEEAASKPSRPARSGRAVSRGNGNGNGGPRRSFSRSASNDEPADAPADDSGADEPAPEEAPARTSRPARGGGNGRPASRKFTRSR